jgi:hypothetical protein
MGVQPKPITGLLGLALTASLLPPMRVVAEPADVIINDTPAYRLPQQTTPFPKVSTPGRVPVTKQDIEGAKLDVEFLNLEVTKGGLMVQLEQQKQTILNLQKQNCQIQEIDKWNTRRIQTTNVTDFLSVLAGGLLKGSTGATTQSGINTLRNIIVGTPDVNNCLQQR